MSIKITFKEPESRQSRVCDLKYGQTFIHKNFPNQLFISLKSGLIDAALQLNPPKQLYLAGCDEVALVDVDIVVKEKS